MRYKKERINQPRYVYQRSKSTCLRWTFLMMNYSMWKVGVLIYEVGIL